MKFKTLITFLIACFLIGCNDSDHYGYNRLVKDIHFKLESIGDERFGVEEATRISFNLTVWSKESELLAEKKFYRVDTKNLSLPKYIHEIFSEAFEGDSVSIIGPTDELRINQLLGDSLFTSNTENVRIELNITEAFSDSRLREILAKERNLNDLELKEQLTIKQLVDSLGLNQDDFSGNIYIKELRSGIGSVPKSGQTAIVNFIARLPKGEIVHDTSLDGPFEYQVGIPEQAVPGLAEGIQLMRKGSVALLLVPSRFGFGEKGSSTGIVPPFSPLIYEIELLDIRG